MNEHIKQRSLSNIIAFKWDKNVNIYSDQLQVNCTGISRLTVHFMTLASSGIMKHNKIHQI